MSAFTQATTEAAQHFERALGYETAAGTRDAMCTYLSTVFGELSKAIRGSNADLDCMPSDDELYAICAAVWGDAIDAEEQQQERRHASLMRRYERA